MGDDKNKQESMPSPTPSQRAREMEACEKAGGLSSVEVEQSRALFKYLLTRSEGPVLWITNDTFWNQLLNKQRFGLLVSNPRVRRYMANLMLGFTKDPNIKEALSAFLSQIDQTEGAKWRAPSSVPPPPEARI